MHHMTSSETPAPPTTLGEPCRLLDSCMPIDVYYSYGGPAPEKEVGGPRAYIAAPGGQIFDVGLSQLTTAAPLDCDSFSHQETYRLMAEIHVYGTRKNLTGPGGKKRRETAAERRVRLDRWDRELI